MVTVIIESRGEPEFATACFDSKFDAATALLLHSPLRCHQGYWSAVIFIGLTVTFLNLPEYVPSPRVLNVPNTIPLLVCRARQGRGWVSCPSPQL